MKSPSPVAQILADGTTETIPIYGWEDGWWIGRTISISPATRSRKAGLAGRFATNSAWFSLVNPEREAVGKLIIYGSPVSAPHKNWFFETETYDPTETLAAQKRWWPFVRDVLWLDGAGIAPLPFPGFVDDAIFEPIDEQHIQAMQSALDPETDTLEDITIAAVLLLESVFGPTTLEADSSISVPFSRGRLNFWWHWGRPHQPWRMNRVSTSEVGEGVLRAESLSALILQMKSAAGAKTGLAPYDVPIILPKSSEESWAPPGRRYVLVDLSPWKLLGLESPYLELKARDFEAWLYAVAEP